MTASTAPVPRAGLYRDGSVKAHGFELDGELHGSWQWFRQDGSLMSSGEFTRGQQVGVWRTWGRAGRLVKETILPANPDT
ncbi:hypothetical protein E3T54_04075 [Cryobacterium sp. Sr8]|uniref:toxin-antitoxin system YwqK family antitoxin n=1 Tax=Cryobacterium sp. Sr8 TaxID=1259203 RepID=UPI00106CE761|nr:hypothetical protein [Cryobacterium sp. Sr8]TFD80112.1 hypothetical protein E3T54_04075 [Cryobacterium sp. Sr8]